MYDLGKQRQKTYESEDTYDKAVQNFNNYTF